MTIVDLVESVRMRDLELVHEFKVVESLMSSGILQFKTKNLFQIFPAESVLLTKDYFHPDICIYLNHIIDLFANIPTIKAALSVKSKIACNFSHMLYTSPSIWLLAITSESAALREDSISPRSRNGPIPVLQNAVSAFWGTKFLPGSYGYSTQRITLHPDIHG